MTRLQRKKQKQSDLISDYKFSERGWSPHTRTKYRGVRKKLKGLRGAKKGLLSKRARILAGDRTLHVVK